ncbi:uncharacterized protein LOC142349576 isoform X3 [Convolutriloba macropyga]|uniref:uncharacterized protein LOC142349576 isoform X3 n=1 Tax=Convolutriloba macropyga TaxID=536237 RepID=UPI003F5267C1
MKNNNISSSSFGSPTNNVLSSKAVIFAVLVIFLSCIRDCNCVWESLVFLIADDRGGPLNVKCSQFSSYTCLYGYLVDERVREHTWDDRYNQVFQILIQNYYKRINWFSMDDSELGSCCAFQTEMYELNGRMMGMSPAEYYHRIMDFRVNNKRLNYLKEWSNEDSNGSATHFNLVNPVQAMYVVVQKNWKDLFFWPSSNFV